MVPIRRSNCFEKSDNASMAGREVSAIAFLYIHPSDRDRGTSSPLELLEHGKMTEIVLQPALTPLAVSSLWPV